MYKTIALYLADALGAEPRKGLDVVQLLKGLKLLRA